MSEPGRFNPFGASGDSQAGSQAQTNSLLHLLKTIADSLSNTSFYTAGTWTPTLLGSAVAGAPTYAANGQVGSYEKIGRLVTARFFISITAVGGMTGNLQIGGLPATPTTTTNDTGSVALNEYTGMTLSAGYNQLGGDIQASATVARIMQSGSAQTALAMPIAGVAATTSISGVLIYRTN